MIDETPGAGPISGSVGTGIERRGLRHLKEQRFGVVGLVIFVGLALMCLLAPVLTPYGYQEVVSAPLGPPSGQHWLGTDEIGRDILTRLLHGGRVSIGIGLVAALFAAVVGVPWGLVSGYFGGKTDMISMRLTDGLLAFPAIILAMATVAVLGPSPVNLMLAVGIVQIPRFTRLVRSETLVVRESEYVTSAIASGAGEFYILRRAIFPNVTSTVIITFTLAFAIAVLTEAGLSFLGLGVQPPQPTWGGMLNAAKNYTQQSSLYAVVSAAPIFATVLSLSLFGDGLREALAPGRVSRRVEQ